MTVTAARIPQRLPAALGVVGAIALTKLLLHLGTNLWGGYGIFRDELYYLACARHLALGYVDQPPLSIFVLALNRLLLGDSIFALRLIPAVAGAGVVLLTGLLARELGGGRFAQALAALASLVSLINLGYCTVYSMNAIDLLLAAAALYFLVRLIRTAEPRYWLAIGLVLGLGLLNKVGMLWVGAGIVVGVVASREGRWLATRWPWLAGGLAALLFLPYMVWNATHDWAHLEFIESAVNGKYSGLGVISFLAGQVLVDNPATLLVWLAGLVFLLFTAAGRPYRALGLVYLTAFAVLLANGHSKAEYLASVYAALYAAGGVAWERWLAAPRLLWLRAVPLAVVAAGALLVPLVLPILPVETYIRYADRLGVAPSTAEGLELAELPQFYADMFGWEEKAAAVAEVYHRLPPAEQARVAIYGNNYGRAGAIDFFGPRYGLPGAIGSHNNYWIWGPGRYTGELVIALGGDREDLERRFESVEEVGRADCRYCIPYERNIPIYLCRRMTLPIAELWPLAKHYM